MNVQLDAELVMELRADCPEEDRLVVGGNDWGYLKVIQIKGGHFEGGKLRGTGRGRLEYGSRRRHGGYRKLQNRIRKIFASDR